MTDFNELLRRAAGRRPPEHPAAEEEQPPSAGFEGGVRGEPIEASADPNDALRRAAANRRSSRLDAADVFRTPRDG